jgi:dihydroorotase-like cyclic amidohydrolase
MHDLVIAGGTLVTASETYKADIGVKDGRIATLGTGLEGRETIDATGKLVMPGGIEAHCHIAQESATGGMTADDYRTGSISAAFGGNSCFIPFAAQHRGMGVTETLETLRQPRRGRLRPRLLLSPDRRRPDRAGAGAGAARRLRPRRDLLQGLHDL